MLENKQLIGLAVFIVILLFFAVLWVRSVWRERSIFKASWAGMTPWKKQTLQFGLLLYAVTPLLESHPAKESYICALSVKLLEASANGLFLVGIVAFLENCSEIYRQDRCPQQGMQRKEPSSGETQG